VVNYGQGVGGESKRLCRWSHRDFRYQDAEASHDDADVFVTSWASTTINLASTRRPAADPRSAIYLVNKPPGEPTSRTSLPNVLPTATHCPLELSQICTFDISGAARTAPTAFWPTNSTSEIAMIVRTDFV
jgi:hypothetical protein